ncbi:rhodanese-like domain-containing protein [Derxia lacustris]|uniref:rhodanese-like domain-containing protein n=1 Tax=Derxia lacustris TaxID=764842 RepID=UPI000A16E671|nr:sulfurtransferase [Derxia lacustris]
MKLSARLVAALVLGFAASASFAQQAAPTAAPAATAAAPAAPAADVWNYKTKRLSRADIDKLLASPKKIVFLDVRRPDEIVAKGSWPVFLNIQVKEIEQRLDFIPKDRQIITVSNHAHRAGAVGDLLATKGFKVAGAAGSEDYEAQGGTIVRIVAPVRQAAAAAPAPAATAQQ